MLAYHLVFITVLVPLFIENSLRIGSLRSHVYLSKIKIGADHEILLIEHAHNQGTQDGCHRCSLYTVYATTRYCLRSVCFVVLCFIVCKC